MKKLLLLSLLVLFFNTISCSKQLVIDENSYIIKNISIIDPIDGLQPNKHVVVGEDLITMILDKDSDFIANDNKIIDGSGKYLIPGLWDAHVHFSYDKSLTSSMPRLFLAHGITSVRDTGGPIDYVLKAKEFSLNEPMKSPNIFIAGPLIDGSPNVYNDSSPSFPLLSIENQDIIDIESNTMGLIDKGIDFLKAYEMLNENQFLIMIMVVAAFLSSFMNNIGAMALLLPITLSACQKMEWNPSKFLMPLAFASILGGMNTVIGTPPNIIIAQYRQEYTGVSFNFFDYSLIY